MIDTKLSPKSWWDAVKSCSGTAADRTNQYRFLAWTAVWGVSFAAATWILAGDRAPPGAVAWLVAALPLVPGALALRAYLRFLRMADEMIRKIQHESLAFGCGCGVMAGVGYPLLELAGAPQFPDLTLLALMLGWSFGQLWGLRRHG